MSEIEKIQKRHDKFEAQRLKEGDYMNDEDGFAAVDDREWLLGEVARLNGQRDAELFRLLLVDLVRGLAYQFADPRTSVSGN